MVNEMPDFRAACAAFTVYIADKNRYISTTDQQGPLRPGESKLRAGRRQYINKILQWDAHKACWLNRDGRPLTTRDLIWVTIIAEMRQLNSYGQRKVWSVVQGKFDGIHEDDVRAACKAWVEHNLHLLDTQDDSQWDLNSEAPTFDTRPLSPVNIDDAGLGYKGNIQLEGPLSQSAAVATVPSDSQPRSLNLQQRLEGSNLERDSYQINPSSSAGSQSDNALLDNDDKDDDDADDEDDGLSWKCELITQESLELFEHERN